MNLNVTPRFTKELPADAETANQTRQVYNACFSYVTPIVPSNPKLLHCNNEMLQAIGLDKNDGTSEEFLSVFSGQTQYLDAKSFAMCYAGHQFGNWAGQLGDGRAINLMEVEHNDQSFTLQLKGAGPTPYSRNADGFAVLRSSIREYLCAEAMHHLGVPTTRSLSLIQSGDQVLRDMLYDGNPEYEKGAIVCRVAPSFIRFGSFEIFAARQDIDNLKRLADFTIRHYFPQIKSEGKKKYIQFFKKVVDTTLEMILHWQRVGFVHGVMNTDNMSIHGITIDYGPYGWVEDYDPTWTPNTTDRQNRRYRYENQPQIGLWNLYKLANALYPLIEETEGLEAILNEYATTFELKEIEMMRSKLGLEQTQEDDVLLIRRLQELMAQWETDMTIFFRSLGTIKKEDTSEIAIEKIHSSFYNYDKITEEVLASWHNWFNEYHKRLQLEVLSDEKRQEAMNQVNPKYVLRNYMAQLAIDAADKEDYSLLDELFVLLQKPYDEQPEQEKWFAKRPDWAKVKIGCSMLSCSS